MIDLSHLQGASVGVLGLGTTGLSAARALRAAGVQVAVWDDQSTARTAALQEGFQVQDLTTLPWEEQSFLLVSPGIPTHGAAPHPAIAAARAAGVMLVTDIDLFGEVQGAHTIVGVTGTNGKSTTTALIHHIFQLHQADVQIGGNFGIPVLDLRAASEGGAFVLELSSYQLAQTTRLPVDVAVFLNLQPDHLPYHGSMAHYIASKRRIFELARSPAQQDQGAVIGVDDEVGARLAEELKGGGAHRVVRISSHRPEADVYFKEGCLVDAMEGAPKRILRQAEMANLSGIHNAQNVAAAYAALRLLDVPVETIKKGLRTFPGLAHRQEVVGEREGIRFINDSKATSFVAATMALDAFENIVWLAGGQIKPSDQTSEMRSLLVAHLQNVLEVITFGAGAAEMAELCRPHRPTHQGGALDEALKEAISVAHRLQKAHPGKSIHVLLAPGGASLDAFRNFEHRGDVFRRLVQTYIGGAP